jgi:putative tricarboxylic transport membrane protein
MMIYDRVGGLIWLLLGVGFCIGSVRLDLGSLEMPGPGFIPFLSGALLALTGLVLLLFPSPYESTEKEKLEIEDRGGLKKHWKKFIFVLLALFSYLFLLEILGFLITSFLFLFFLLKLTEPKGWVRPLFYSGGVIILSYIIFILILECPFPIGIFRLG